MKMPSNITRKISERAAAIARQTAPKKTGKGASMLEATSAPGVIGIEVPAEVKYMIYQDQGTEPRLQTELAGKTIPIRNANGTISFRRATDNNIGRVKIVSRNEKGEIIGSKISWKHPGIEGKHFIDKALRQAVSEWAQTATGQDLIRILDESEVSMLMRILRGQS